MSRQFRRLQSIRLRATAQRVVPPGFMARRPVLGILRPNSGADRSSWIVDLGSFSAAAISRSLALDGQLVEVDAVGRVRKEARQ